MIMDLSIFLFGPVAPENHQSETGFKTIPGKGWYAILRIYERIELKS